MSDVATWTAVQVFGDVNAHHGSCCDCCIGYCPGSDNPPRPTPPHLYRVGPYLSDKYVAVLADLIDPEGVGDPSVYPAPAAWTIPDAVPPTATALFVPSRAARLLALGLNIRGGDKHAHLYLDGEHVGYLMPAERGRTIAEIPDLLRVVDEAQAEPRSNPGRLIEDVGAEAIDAVMLILDVADEIRALLSGDPS